MFLMCPHKKERKKGKGHFYFLFLKMVAFWVHPPRVDIFKTP
jgi:hypothetical protein